MQRDRVLLDDMRAAATRIVALVEELSFKDFADQDTQREAVLWNLTILGEAASQLSVELREKHPKVRWRDPIDLRNRVVHGYSTVDVEIVYQTAITHVPRILDDIQVVIAAEYPPDGD